MSTHRIRHVRSRLQEGRRTVSRKPRRDCGDVPQRNLILEHGPPRTRTPSTASKYGFGSIQSDRGLPEERSRSVSYEDIKADMKRVTEGAKGVFTAEDPVMFAQTSGTTGDPKFVPITPTCQGGSRTAT